MKKFIIILAFIAVWPLAAQIPARPVPDRFVNDLAHLFTPEEIRTLEYTLGNFSDSTSNQIVIITLPDLGGYDKMQMAYEIGQNWGVGKKDFNNGIVILVKPKNETRGEIAIAVGYGLEGVLPDALCRRIIDEDIIPYFRQNQYYQGVFSGVNVIMLIAKGEYNQGSESEGVNLLVVLGLIIFIFFIAFLLSRKGKGDSFKGDKSSGMSPFWLFLLGSGSGRSSGGSWGGFSGGGRGGGFGGGSFGGGGAGGSW